MQWEDSKKLNNVGRSLCVDGGGLTTKEVRHGETVKPQ